MNRIAKNVAAISVVLLSVARLAAAPGDLDTTFGKAGKVATSFNTVLDPPVSVIVRNSGKIIVVSRVTPSEYRIGILRFNPNGSPDTSFGANGKIVADLGTESIMPTAAAVQSDSKRFTSGGDLDSTFSSDGKATVTFGDLTAQPHAVAVQPSHLGGKIVLAGYNTSLSFSGPKNNFAMFRFNSNGTADAQFGSGGRVFTDFGTDRSVINDIELVGTKIIAAGKSGNSSTTYDFALARYNLNGSLDTTFDGDGKVTTSFGPSSDIAFSLLIQSDGKIVATGSGRGTGDPDDNFALARYLTNGSLDTSFSTDGRVTTNFLDFTDRPSSAVLQPDGKILLAGSAYSGSNYDIALARYQP